MAKLPIDTITHYEQDKKGNINITITDLIRCKDCKHRYEIECPMRHIEWVEYEEDGYFETDDIIYDRTIDDGFCDRGEREDE